MALARSPFVPAVVAPVVEPKNKTSRVLQVSFRKRRQGLFKKAEEVTSICGGKVAVAVFSPAAGKHFGFGAVDLVVGKYRDWLRRRSAPPVEEEAPRNPDLWWRQSIDELGLEELKDLKEVLQAHRRQLLEKWEARDVDLSGETFFTEDWKREIFQQF